MQRKLKITVDGKPYTVTVEDVTEGAGNLYPEPGLSTAAVQAAPAPAPAAAAAPSAPAAPSAGGGAGAGEEVAPLSGVVVSIDVTQGQQVNEGDKIATLEAMKMKTVVVSHRTGTVGAIYVNAGDGIEAGQPILSIE